MPPRTVSVNFETGTSGTISKVLRSRPLLVGVGDAGELDVDLAVQRGDQVRQFVFGVRAQVDRAFERAVEQRRRRFGEAVDRVRRAFVGGELDPGADVADVRLFEDQRFRQRDLRARDVGVAGAGDEGRPQFRFLRSASGRRRSAGRACGLKPRLSQPLAWNGLEAATELKLAGSAGLAPPPCSVAFEGGGRAVGRVERELRPVDLDRDRADVEQGAPVDMRDRVGDRRHLGRLRVEEQRHPAPRPCRGRTARPWRG